MSDDVPMSRKRQRVDPPGSLSRRPTMTIATTSKANDKNDDDSETDDDAYMDDDDDDDAVDYARLPGTTMQDARRVNTMIEELKSWDGSGGKMKFLQSLVHKVSLLGLW